jgi:hypothetical protein
MINGNQRRIRMNKQEIEKAISLLKSDIGVLDNYLKKHPLVISHYLEKDRCIENQLIKDMEFTISALEHQLTNGWIPVSERLPEEGRYLVTTVYGEVKESEFDLEKWWQIDNSTISLAWEEEPIKVVAWQPLPEPYKELATDNNVVTKSGKDNNAKDADLSPEEAQELKAERDYWEMEAKKWCAKL